MGGASGVGHERFEKLGRERIVVGDLFAYDVAVIPVQTKGRYYGEPLKKNETRETLIECKRRPKGKSCIGLMWVDKTENDGILAHCVVCKAEEAFVHNWQDTEWADGMMEAVTVTFDESKARRP